MFAHYLRLMVFAFGLLVGVQVPAFVGQYAARVSAHEIEIAKNFAGFQDTADKYFGGSVDALIAHHLASPDPAFKDEARSIEAMYQRLQVLRAELAALRAPLIQQIVHVAFRANREILNETWAEYSYTVPLNPAAIATGIVGGVLLALGVELILVGVLRMVVRRPARPSRPSRPRLV
jgi:hypothetical protein